MLGLHRSEFVFVCGSALTVSEEGSDEFPAAVICLGDIGATAGDWA